MHSILLKLPLALSFFIFICWFRSSAQTSSPYNKLDTSLSKKLTIAGFCLCETTVQDLKDLDKELQQVDVEEMDLCSGGFTQDIRFINRKGYSSKKYPGMIFQPDNDNHFISKIRLTKDFKGNLPDGTPVDMRSLLAKDVIKRYPAFDTWKSRGCSNYWNLTNDTLAFFVRIDKNKKPQYPVDETYYKGKPVEGIDLVVSCDNIYASYHVEKGFTEPVYFIDSIKVTKEELLNYQPEDIAIVSVYEGTSAINLAGAQGSNGAIYIETKVFARKRYWDFFKSRSSEYLKAVPNPGGDSTVVYILNDKVLKDNFEGDLSKLSDKTLVELKVIDKKRLIKDFGISDKTYGILIKSNTKEQDTK